MTTTNIIKFGKDINIIPIKLKNKNTTKELEEILYGVNDILYEFSYLYITNTAKEYIMNKLVEYGKQLNNIYWPLTKGTGKSSRKEELRTKMLDVYKSLQSYLPSSQSSNKQIDSNHFLVSLFLKEKKNNNGLNDDIAIKWIKKLKLISSCYGITQTLKSVNDECLNHFQIKQTI